MLDTITWQMIVRLCLAALLGGIVGMERGSGDRPAGLRTHILVCTGSALFMLISLYGFDPRGGGNNWDESRIASQVVSGIGFLGAGTILHEGMTVRGLTTAASLWMVSAVGLAVGSGFMLIGIVATVITMITLVTFHGWEKRLPGTGRLERRYIRVAVKNDPESIPTILAYLADKQVKVRTINVKNDKLKELVLVDLYLKINKEYNTNEIIGDLNNLPCVDSIENVI